MTGHPSSHDNATGSQEGPQQHEVSPGTSSSDLAHSQAAESSPSKVLAPEYDQEMETGNNSDLEDSDLTAAAENLALYLSSLEGQENIEQVPGTHDISQLEKSSHSPSHNQDADDDLQYDDLTQMLEAAAAAVEESVNEHGNDNLDNSKSKSDQSPKKLVGEYGSSSSLEKESQNHVDHPDVEMEENDSSLENLQESINELVRLHGLNSDIPYTENQSLDSHDHESEESSEKAAEATSVEKPTVNSLDSNSGNSEDISNILLNALELALGNNQDNQESEGSKIEELPNDVEDISKDSQSHEKSDKVDEPEFDLEMLQEILMSAEHVKAKENDVEGDTAEDSTSQPIRHTNINDPAEDGQDDHQEILAQLSSLLHPDDIEEPSTLNDPSSEVMESLSTSLKNQTEQAQDDNEDESGAIDFSLVVSAIQSALEEAAVDSGEAEEGIEVQEDAEDHRGAFSKVEIQDALKSLTDSDGSILLDLSSKSLVQRALPLAQNLDGAESSEAPNEEEDDEETMRSTANLVEVLLQSGLLSAESLGEGAFSKSRPKSNQRGTAFTSNAARVKNLRQAKPPVTASQYNSTMSIAETLAYTRSHMNQRPTEAKIDPMVTRRELNRTALLKARQIYQPRGSSRTAPTYYIPTQPQTSLDKELSYRLYTPSAAPASKSSETTSQRGQFRLSNSSEEPPNRVTQTGTRKRPGRTRFYYYTPPTTKPTQNGQEKPGPSFVPNAPSRTVENIHSDASNDFDDSSVGPNEDGEHNLLAALLLAKRAFGSQGEASPEALSDPVVPDKGQSEIVDAETMKAIQAALEAVGTTLAVEENKESKNSEAISANTPLPPLPLPTYTKYPTSRASSPTPSESTLQSTPRNSFSSTASPLRRPRRKLNVGGVLSADERERVRIENRERKKRWRGQNMDRNRDNDLRGRVTRRANQIYGTSNTPQKMKWIEAEFQNRKMKRLERGVGFDTFSFSNYNNNNNNSNGNSKATNPVQSVMPEGSQQRFGSTEAEGSGNNTNGGSEGNSEFICAYQPNLSTSIGGVWQGKQHSETETQVLRSPQPSGRRNSGSSSRTKPLSSGGTNPSFFASRGTKAPTPLPMGGIVTSFKLKTNRNSTPKSKSHLFSPARPSVDGSTQSSPLIPETALSLKRKRSVSGNTMPSSSSTLSSLALYSAGLIPPHLLPPDVSPVPLPKPLPFNGPSSAKKLAVVKKIMSSDNTDGGDTSGTSSSVPSSLSSTGNISAEKVQEHSKLPVTPTLAADSDPSPGKSITPVRGNIPKSTSPGPSSASPRLSTPIAEDKRVRAMGFPPIMTGMTLRR